MNELLLDVMTASRNALCGMFPAWNTAFAYLPFRQGTAIGTDGRAFYGSEALLRLYARSPAAVRRGYLHVLLHCLYLHMFGSGECWDLACDLWTERFISSLGIPGLETDNPLRDRVLAALGDEPLTVEAIERLLTRENMGIDRETLEAAFRFDDHSLWRGGNTEELRRRWQSLMAGSGEQGSGRGSRPGDQEEEITLLAEDHLDYRKYLRKYTVPGEVLELDDESFDYISYDLGMRLYGNLPLLEPLEYKEVRRLDELVIAIDTSMSCDRDTVARFLEESYSILSDQENFFRRMRVVFLQCDCCLQDTRIIRSREEWLAYARNLKIIGRGGTDYTPVFLEIEKLRALGVLKKPRALLYFTDGDGVYPTQPPDYETVFILAGRQIHPELVPGWAVRRMLKGNDDL